MGATRTYKRTEREGFEPSLELPLNSISSAMTKAMKRLFDKAFIFEFSLP